MTAAAATSVTAAAILRPAAGKLMRRAALASLVVSILLVLLKAIAYLVTDSVAMLSALADSGLDVFTSAINLVAVHQALQPADEEHRFGHGKAEPLAGLAQGAFIAGSATFLVIAAINTLPWRIRPSCLGAAAAIVSGVGRLLAISCSVSGLVFCWSECSRETGSWLPPPWPIS